MKMKRIIFTLFVVSILSISCGGAKQETVDKMADELCAAMSLHDESNPMSSIEVVSALTKVQQKVEEYGKVTEDQIMKAMKEKCPDGLELYKEYTSQTSE
jgi:hypothetical protein